MNVTTDRQDVIRRAVELIDTAGPAAVARWLAETNIHDPLKEDPAFLRGQLAECLSVRFPASPGRRFSAWKVSQQILQAAGKLPY